MSVTKIDPSRTLTLRKQFAGQVTRRVKRIQPALAQWQPISPLSPAAQLQAFSQHVYSVAAQALLEPDTPAPQRYTRQWVQRAYHKGCRRAFTDAAPATRFSSQQEDLFFQGSRQQFIADTLHHPKCRETVELLTVRLEQELQGLVDTIVNRLVREYANQLVLNFNKRQLKAFATQLDISISKARTIANTEIVRAQAEGILDSYERLGKSHVKVLIEWTTADKPCKLCEALSGVVLTIKEARGLFPRHPNCKCTPVVKEYTGAMGPELTKGRRKRIRALERSIEREKPKTGKRRKPGRPRTSRWTKTVKRKYEEI